MALTEERVREIVREEVRAAEYSGPENAHKLIEFAQTTEPGEGDDDA